MKDPNDHIKKLFSEFEPEANDASIQQSWEEVRYFLPQEKKRRGFIFWKYAGLGLAFIALVLLPLSWYFYNAGKPGVVVQKKENIKSEQNSEARETFETPGNSFKTKNKTNVNVPASAPAPAIVNQTPPANQSPPVKAQLPPTALPGHIISEDEKDITPQATNPATTNYSTAVTFNPPVTTQIVPANSAIEAGTGITETKQEANTASTEQNSTQENALVATEPLPTQEFVFLPVQQPVALINDPTVTTTVTPLLPLPLPLKEKFILQVFGGGAYATTRLRYLKYDDQQTYNSIQPSFGALVGYQFKNKVRVVGQFVFLSNRITYDYSRQDTLKVPKGPFTLTGLDTSQKYVISNTYSRLEFSPAYNIALGFDFPVWNNRRTEVSTSLLVNLSSVKYSFENTYLQKVDTLPYSIIKSSGFANVSPSAMPLNRSFLESVKSAGLMPGITVSYKLYKNLALIAKPSYLLQITEKKNVVENLFDLKQNTFFMHVGIQFKW